MATISSVETTPVVRGEVERPAARENAAGKLESASAVREAKRASNASSRVQEAESSKTEAKEVSLTKEQANELAVRLEKAINAAFGKEIRFNVSAEKSQSNRFNFQVVDSKTGEVVRQFPSEELTKVASGIEDRGGQGLLVDSPA